MGARLRMVMLLVMLLSFVVDECCLMSTCVRFPVFVNSCVFLSRMLPAVIITHKKKGREGLVKNVFSNSCNVNDQTNRKRKQTTTHANVLYFSPTQILLRSSKNQCQPLPPQPTPPHSSTLREEATQGVWLWIASMPLSCLIWLLHYLHPDCAKNRGPCSMQTNAGGEVRCATFRLPCPVCTVTAAQVRWMRMFLHRPCPQPPTRMLRSPMHSPTCLHSDRRYFIVRSSSASMEWTR